MSRSIPNSPGLGMLERNLASLDEALERSLFAERIARRPGLLQSLDPRVRLVSVLLTLVAVSWARSLLVILALYAAMLALAALSAVPLGVFVKRVWLLLPFFTGVIALPALFTVPGPALAYLPLGLIVTRTGASAALFLVLRVGTSVSAVTLLVLTTPWNSLLKSLGVLRVPDVFVLILGMTYRYIFLLLRSASEMFLARRSRVLGPTDPASGRRLLAASAGVLLSKSLQTSSDVYLAMQSRGFYGYPRTMDPFVMRTRDWVYAGASLLILAGALWLGR